MRTSQKSQLPRFIKGDIYKTAVGDSDKEVEVMEVTCPRSHCGKTFIVVIKDWYKPNSWQKRQKQLVGQRAPRSCPYCFSTARMPKRKG